MIRKVLKYAMSVFALLLVVTVCVAMVYNSRIGVETNLAKSVLLGERLSPLASETTLRVVTFNIHDLYVASGNRPERMKAIGRKLAELDPDVVGIQESFIAEDRAILLGELSGSRLAFNQYYPSATVGCGLLVMSAYPIVETFLHRYSKNGKWYKFYHGDWWAGKGVALARLKLPGGYVDFYDTHAHARYGSDEYVSHQEVQMEELAQFVRASALGWAPAFLVGDMNCSKGSKPYEIATQKGRLKRLMQVDSAIDHIFGVESPHYEYEVLETQEIRGEAPVANGHSELSDHPGYMSVVRIIPRAG